MNTSARPSTQRLLNAIDEEIGDADPSGLQQQLRALAARDYYHDFFGEPPFPITALVNDSHAAGLPNLRTRAINGEFDSGVEEDTGMGSSD